MKLSTIILTFLATCTVLYSQDLGEEVAVIKQTIQTAYVEGIQNEGNLEKIDSGIHPEFALLGVNEDGSLWKLPITEWKQRVDMRRAEGKLPKTEDLISIKFLDVDVTGTAAVAKFEFYVGEALKYVDYISLYKINGKWMMVSKTFYAFD